MLLADIPHEPIQVVRDLLNRAMRHPRFAWEELGRHDDTPYANTLVLEYRETTPIKVTSVFGEHHRHIRYRLEVLLVFSLIELYDDDGAPLPARVEIELKERYAETSCFYGEKQMDELPESTQRWMEEQADYICNDLKQIVREFACTATTLSA